MLYHSESGGDTRGDVVDTYPEGTRQEGNHATHVARFLALGRNTLVCALPEPDVGLHVPGIKKDFEVGCEFDIEDINVGCAFPLRLAILVETGETKAGDNTRSLERKVILDRVLTTSRNAMPP